MRRLSHITRCHVIAADEKVRREICRAGLMTHALKGVAVAPSAARDVMDYYGCFDRETRCIFIPVFSVAALVQELEGCGAGVPNLEDVICHEYGHAYACLHPRRVRWNRTFRRVFGEPYDSVCRSRSGSPWHFVAPRAMLNPAEDFAETFRVVVRGGGPARKTGRLRKKMEFVRGLCRPARATAA
jgi:hypothetical protein